MSAEVNLGPSHDRDRTQALPPAVLFYSRVIISNRASHQASPGASAGKQGVQAAPWDTDYLHLCFHSSSWERSRGQPKCLGIPPTTLETRMQLTAPGFSPELKHVGMIPQMKDGVCSPVLTLCHTVFRIKINLVKVARFGSCS